MKNILSFFIIVVTVLGLVACGVETDPISHLREEFPNFEPTMTAREITLEYVSWIAYTDDLLYELSEADQSLPFSEFAEEANLSWLMDAASVENLTVMEVNSRAHQIRDLGLTGADWRAYQLNVYLNGLFVPITAYSEVFIPRGVDEGKIYLPELMNFIKEIEDSPTPGVTVELVIFNHEGAQLTPAETGAILDQYSFWFEITPGFPDTFLQIVIILNEPAGT